MLASLVVFVGIAGKHADGIEHQLQPVLAKAHIAERSITPGDLGALARHADASRAVVQQLHADAVVGAALIESGGSLTLRVVIYDGSGNLKSLGETPLGGRALSKDELEVIASNLDDELGEIVAKAPAAPAPATPAPKSAPKAKAELAEVSFDDDTPAALGPQPQRAAKSKPDPAPHDAAPTETASASATDSDAVSLDDVAALNSGGGGEADAAAVTASASPSESGLHLHAGASIGVGTRSFAGPAGVQGYSSSAVGTAHVEAGLSPTRDFALAAMAEHSLGMMSSIGSATAATSISRWELTATYTLTHGAVQIAPLVGVGQRDFSIESSAPQRSPDTDYGYALIGATAAVPLGSRFAAHGLAAFEPVFGGSTATDMELGPATRWALDVGAGVDVRVFSHLLVRGALDYQRFAWSWSSAGARGAGGATDSYPCATIGIGADY